MSNGEHLFSVDGNKKLYSDSRAIISLEKPGKNEFSYPISATLLPDRVLLQSMAIDQSDYFHFMVPNSVRPIHIKFFESEVGDS